MPGIFEEDPNVSMFEFIQAYQQINQLTVSEEPDMSLDPYYGVALEDAKWKILGNKEMHIGSLSKDGMELIKLVAVKDLAHWNYKPEAKLIWDFFKNYERDPETKELVVSGSQETPTEENNSNTWIYVVLVAVAAAAVGGYFWRRNRK